MSTWFDYEALEDEAGLVCASRVDYPLFTNLAKPPFAGKAIVRRLLGPRDLVVEGVLSREHLCVFCRKCARMLRTPRFFYAHGACVGNFPSSLIFGEGERGPQRARMCFRVERGKPVLSCSLLRRSRGLLQGDGRSGLKTMARRRLPPRIQRAANVVCGSLLDGRTHTFY